MDGENLLLQEIETFLRGQRMAETTFGRLAVNDGKLVGRLRNGSTITMATLQRIRAFIDSAAAPTEP